MTETEKGGAMPAAEGKKDGKNNAPAATNADTMTEPPKEGMKASNGVAEKGSAQAPKAAGDPDAGAAPSAEAQVTDANAEAKGADANAEAKVTDANAEAKVTDANPEAKGTDPNTVTKGTDANTEAKPTDANTEAKPTDENTEGENPEADSGEPTEPEIVVKAVGKSSIAAKSAAEAIERDLSASARAHYEFAYPLVTKSPNLEKLETATERLVKALQEAPEEKCTTRGYGELSLLYGRALLGFVIRGAAEGDVLGSKAKAGDDEDVEEKEEEEGEKEETTEELCWTQLEVARLAFQKSGTKDRLCECVRTIGEFLLACDQATAAGEEFGSAAGMCEGREKAECLYKRYLSLRRVSVDDAKKSLQDAIGALKTIEGTEGVVKEMCGELTALGGDEGKGVKRSAEVTVTRVTPKRRKNA